MVLSLVEGEAPPNAKCQRIGPALLFERLWHEVGCRAVLEELAAGEFAAERAVFLTVLHRLFVPGSDRAAEKWRADYRIEGTEALQLHHLYRAMAWLGEPLADQAGASELTPRCRKDLVEEGLFARRRDLFAELSVVFMDTTSLSFEGRGGEERGRRGNSKDYRPDLHQMIVGLVMDQDGRPLCSELWPGNTADVATLLPVVDRLRARFSVGRICVVADRGMISAQSIAALEERKLEYVLGVRERSSAEVRSTVIDDQTPLVPLVVPRASGELTELEAKQVKIGDRRYYSQATGISLSSVQSIWRAHKLQPHRLRTFKRSRDPSFAAKLVDIVGLYVDPPAHAAVASLDEKSQIQALDRTQPRLPIKPGRCQTLTYDYKRHGTTTLFAALSVLDGTVIGSCM
jgi:hypothetical protein